MQINPEHLPQFIYAAEYAKPFLLESWKTLHKVIEEKIIYNKSTAIDLGLKNLESLIAEIGKKLSDLESKVDSLEDLEDKLEDASTHPNFYYLLNTISVSAFRTSKIEKHQILASLLVNKIFFGMEEKPYIDKAIETIQYLTMWDLRRLSLIYIITSYEYRNPIEENTKEAVTSKLEEIFTPFENAATRMYQIENIISNGLFIPRPGLENEDLDYILMRRIENNQLRIYTDRFYLDPINEFIENTEVGMKLQSAFAIIKSHYALSTSGKIIAKTFLEILPSLRNENG
ncbi:MAG: hypothetical protein CL609_23635 [Anaerolineaceae bacterium]|nr:hypothetical protein [Anaerolineaceae bacterium]